MIRKLQKKPQKYQLSNFFQVYDFLTHLCTASLACYTFLKNALNSQTS